MNDSSRTDDGSQSEASKDSKHWLSHSYLLDGSGACSLIEPDSLRDWKPEHGTVWLHLDLTNLDARYWLVEESGIASVAVDSLLEVESRPRLTRVGDAALMALRGVNYNPGATPDDMIGLRIWLEKDRVVTSYRRKLKSIDDVLGALQDGSGPSTAAEVVTELARHLVLRMTETVDSLEELTDGLEEQLIEGTNSETRLSLANLRRQVIALRRYLAPQREALSSLIVAKFSWVGEDLRLSLRETNDRLSRHLEDLEAIRERAAVTQEELQNRLAERQNVRMYVLSIFTAVFLPLGFLTGLLGINIGGMPGADNPSAFWIFAASLVVITVSLIAFFRYRKWF